MTGSHTVAAPAAGYTHKMWVITQLYGRTAISKLCLKQLHSVLPPHAELHIWDDHSPDDTTWAAEYGTIHKERAHLGIEHLRCIQIAAAVAAGVTEVYLTDTDAMHDPGWYAVAVALYGRGAPVCLFNSRHHAKQTISVHDTYAMRRHAPGISWYMRQPELMQLNPRVRKTAGWDWHFATVLKNRCVVSLTSYVEHYGAGGLHNATWENDMAVNPTPYLKAQHAEIMAQLPHTIRAPDIAPRIREIATTARDPVAVINQPRGIGDIIFLLRAMEGLRDLGYRIKWLVEPAFMDMAKHAPWITYVPYTQTNYTAEDADTRAVRVDGNVVTLPLRWSDTVMNVPYRKVMPAKYDMLGFDWRTWSKAAWVRDRAAEDRLAAQLKLPRKFALVNRRYTSTGGRVIHLPRMTLPVVETQPIPGFTAIDWVGVAERATEIHTVGTGTVFVIDALARELTPRIYLYPRVPQERDCGNYDYLLTRKWRIVQ